QHAPREVLVPAEPVVPRRQDGGVESLGVPVRVARERPDIVRGDDAKAPAARPGRVPEDEHATEKRELIGIERQRSGAQPLANLAERPGLDDAPRPAPTDQAA